MVWLFLALTSFGVACGGAPPEFARAADVQITLYRVDHSDFAPRDTSTARFHGYRILAARQLVGRERDDLLDTLSNRDNFQYADRNGNVCPLPPEVGVDVKRAHGSVDLLLNLACARVQALEFEWPHGTQTSIHTEALTYFKALSKW